MNIIKPGAGILFMKVGTHAQESLDDILARKNKEIEDAGFAMWGYGGNTCHPRTMVQPFAREYEERHSPIYLCMQEMDSRHFAEPLRASQYSPDGTNWQPIPNEINVTGSRFALVLETLETHESPLQLANSRVAVGLSQGRPAPKYLKGQVDKACLEILDEQIPGEEAKDVQISLVAKLMAPYAVFLRDRR